MSDVRYQESLAARTTFQIGGPAERLVVAESEAEIAAVAREPGLVVLGGGSNVLIADEGLRGLVLAPALKGISLRQDREHVLLTAAAGEVWEDVVAFAAHEGLAGLECLAGIPGWTGAVPIQNVGAYGQEVADTIIAVRSVDRVDGEIRERSAVDCAFAYRDSVFKHGRRDRDIVVGVTFRLRRGPAAPARYGELSKALGEGEHAVAHVRATVLALRRAKGMVLSADDPDTVSAGSFFTNPIVSAHELPRLRQVAETVAPGVSMPTFAIAGDDTRVKLAAGWLIERAGFRKGETRGAVGLSSKHALALINRGGGRASEIVAFAREIQARVRAVFGVDLEPEPVMLGF
jgi:UDP-N-acetylmuramate dehydrogenase